MLTFGNPPNTMQSPYGIGATRMKAALGGLAIALVIVAGFAGAREEIEAPEPAPGTGGQQSTQQMSDEDQWACEVAMCLSNPAGPTAVAECLPPINKMHRELAKGNVIPHCKFLGSGNTGGGGGEDDGGTKRTKQL